MLARAPLTIRRATVADAAAWDALAQREGTFFHRFAWSEIVEDVLGHEAVYLMAERSGEVVGLLPLVDRRSRLFGRALISTGFVTGGGVVAIDDAAQQGLIAHALEEVEARNADFVELRGGGVPGDEWHTKTGIYETFDAPLISDEAERLQAIPRKKRADVRKAIAAAAVGDLTAETADDAPRFWAAYARGQRNHGTPVLPRAWIERQCALFGDDAEMMIVRSGDQWLAGVLTFYHRGRALLYTAFILPAARAQKAGDYLYWWMMRHALDRGADTFDFGRSKCGTGAHAYKVHWGFEPKPLPYYYRLRHTDEMPNVNPQNPKFALMTRVWQRLPMPIANSLGPVVSRHLG